MVRAASALILVVRTSSPYYLFIYLASYYLTRACEE